MKKPFMMIDAKHIRLSASPSGVIEGFEAPQDYPNCCDRHKQALKYVTDWWKEFPDCCDHHKEMAIKHWFNKDDYGYVPEKILTCFLYFEYHVSQKINNDNWFKDINNYIDHLSFSFGHPPVGFHQLTVLMEHFVEYTKPTDWDFSEDRRKTLLDHMRRPVEDNVQKRKNSDLNLLYTIYQKWLKAVPNVAYFSYLKQRTTNKIPMNLFLYEHEHNPYLGMTSSKVRTNSELLQILIDTTKKALSNFDTTQYVKEGLITEAQQLNINLINENHRVKQFELSEEFNKTEIRYIKIVKKWLSNEKKYFKEILPLIQSLPAPSPTKEKKYNWIRYVKYQTDIEPLKDLLDGLKKIGCISNTATFPNFKKIFSGEELKDPYHWAGNIGDLATLIKELDKQLKIEKLSFKWKTTAATFTNADDIPFDKEKLRNSKATTNADRIIELVSYL